MDWGDNTAVGQAVAASLCDDPDIEFVVAFGSRLTGTPTTGSDLDIAVKFDPTLSDSERFDKLCFLSGDLQCDGAPFVDISDLERLPTEVAHDAVTDGRFVCGDSRAFERYKQAIEASFQDGREERQRTQRELIDRIAAEGLRG